MYANCIHKLCLMYHWNLVTNVGLYFSFAAYWNMDNSDEDSQNSSENSFNEMVTAAMAGGYAFVYMLQVPPQGNHVISVPELTGRQWVDKLLSDASRCFES